MVEKTKILIIDDDPDICELIKAYLEKHDFVVCTRNNGRDILDVLNNNSIDLIVLDVMLPGDDGLTLCQKVRQTSDVMIIMLSAMGEDTDRIVGLEMGADDYLAKPFNPRELLARIKSLVRRTTGGLGEERKQRQLSKVPNIKFANWIIDRNKRQLISADGVTIPLTAAEYELLLAFVENANRVLSRDQLLNMTHNRDAGPFDRTIDVQVGRLRKKLEDNPKEPIFLTTVRGGGYQFNAEVEYE